MKESFKVISIICILLLSCIQFNKTIAQDNSNVKEPPIPVYLVSPYHEDSLCAAYEGYMQGNVQAYVNIINKVDTIQRRIQKSSAESTVHFIWLYSLVALLGIMNIVLLILTSRIRKEMVQIKRLEHHQLHLTSESASISQQSTKIQEVLSAQETTQVKPLLQTTKPRTRKQRSNTQK